MIGLTPHQHKLLTFIRSYIGRTGGVAPSFEEMMDGVGASSKSRIHALLVGLEEREAIRRLPHKSRAIEVIA